MATRSSRIRFILVMGMALMLLSAIPLVMAQDDDVFRVAAVAPSATNDLAFSQSMYDALRVVEAELGPENFEFVFQDGTFVVDDAAVALREWAASGEFDLVIAHGSQFGSILQELAPDFPEVSFAWGTDNDTFGLDNVFAYTAAAEEGGYINGVLAARMTETGVIGVVGPIEVGDAKLYVDGFVAGAAAENPDVTVNVAWIQSFSDVPLATEAAATHVANDADILTGTAQMVVGPIAVAKDNGLPWFGTQSSQAELAEDSGVLFQIYRWDVALGEIIDLIAGGTLGGQAFTIALDNGGLVMEVDEDRFAGDAEALAAFQAEVDALVEGIVSGDIVVFPDEGAADAVATEEAGG